MTEKAFEKTLKLNLKYNGFFVRKIEGVDGIPDLLVGKKQVLFLIELKIIEFKKDKALKYVFKDTQPPFYIDLLARTDYPYLFVIMKLSNKQIDIIKINLDFAKNIHKMKYSQIKEYADYYKKVKSISECIDTLNSFL